MITKDVRNFLQDSDAVRHRVDGRIFRSQAPENTRGELIIVRGDSTHEYSLQNEIGTRNSVVQIDCYSDTSANAESLFELVRNRLSGFRGMIGETEIYSITIIGGMGDFAESPRDASDQWFHRYSKDFSIFHSQSVPTHA